MRKSWIGKDSSWRATWKKEEEEEATNRYTTQSTSVVHVAVCAQREPKMPATRLLDILYIKCDAIVSTKIQDQHMRFLLCMHETTGLGQEMQSHE